jgi:transcription elongation factor GreB
VSKAFTTEETGEAPVLVRARAPLPAGLPNYVTERGLQLLNAEAATLKQQRSDLEATGGRADDPRLVALATRLAELHARIGSAVRVPPPDDPAGEIRFGATVLVRDGAGAQRSYQIVGVDEADAREGRVAFVSPLGRALLGRRAGQVAMVRTPRGEDELEVLAVRYDGSTPPG